MFPRKLLPFLFLYFDLKILYVTDQIDKAAYNKQYFKSSRNFKSSRIRFYILVWNIAVDHVDLWGF